MDLTTLLGLLIAWGAVLLSIMLEGGHLSAFVNLPAALIVFGGTAGAALIGLPAQQAAGVVQVLLRAFFGRPVSSVEVIELLADLIRRARRDGVLALEVEIKSIDNEFLRSGLQLVIDGTSQELLRDILKAEIAAMRARHEAGQAVFGTLGGFAPTLGIIGTVMGLIHMLGKLDKPEDMGHSIAAAFIATLYGVSIANLIFLPIANKLKANSEEELTAYELAVEGILGLQAGESPRVAATRMRSFLSPQAKRRIEAAGGQNE
ncbi:MAG TPA: flagellar motor protein [Armatimonadota bacterium]|nr:flagellar motor protein [Armatimonadota bacterium]